MEKCLNMLGRDSVICWFLFELLCCLAKTYARLWPKHNERSRQWQRCLQGEFRAEPQLTLPTAQQLRRRQNDDQETLRGGKHLCQELPELDIAELNPCSVSRVERAEIQPVAVNRTASSSSDHWGSLPISCSSFSSYRNRSEQLIEGRPVAESRMDTMLLSQSEDVHSAKASGRATIGSNSGLRTNRTCDGFEDLGGSTACADMRAIPACICGDRGCGEQAIKRLRREGEARIEVCSLHGPSGFAAGRGPTKSEINIDLDSMLLSGFEEDHVARDTEYVVSCSSL